MIDTINVPPPIPDGSLLAPRETVVLRVDVALEKLRLRSMPRTGQVLFGAFPEPDPGLAKTPPWPKSGAHRKYKNCFGEAFKSGCRRVKAQFVSYVGPYTAATKGGKGSATAIRGIPVRRTSIGSRTKNCGHMALALVARQKQAFRMGYSVRPPGSMADRPSEAESPALGRSPSEPPDNDGVGVRQKRRRAQKQAVGVVCVCVGE